MSTTHAAVTLPAAEAKVLPDRADVYHVAHVDPALENTHEVSVTVVFNNPGPEGREMSTGWFRVEGKDSDEAKVTLSTDSFEETSLYPKITFKGSSNSHLVSGLLIDRVVRAIAVLEDGRDPVLLHQSTNFTRWNGAVCVPLSRWDEVFPKDCKIQLTYRVRLKDMRTNTVWIEGPNAVTTSE